jgi:hypothetical protein
MPNCPRRYTDNFGSAPRSPAGLNHRLISGACACRSCPAPRRSTPGCAAAYWRILRNSWWRCRGWHTSAVIFPAAVSRTRWCSVEHQAGRSQPGCAALAAAPTAKARSRTLAGGAARRVRHLRDPGLLQHPQAVQHADRLDDPRQDQLPRNRLQQLQLHVVMHGDVLTVRTYGTRPL